MLCDCLGSGPCHLGDWSTGVQPGDAYTNAWCLWITANYGNGMVTMKRGYPHPIGHLWINLWITTPHGADACMRTGVRWTDRVRYRHVWLGEATLTPIHPCRTGVRIVATPWYNACDKKSDPPVARARSSLPAYAADFSRPFSRVPDWVSGRTYGVFAAMMRIL